VYPTEGVPPLFPSYLSLQGSIPLGPGGIRYPVRLPEGLLYCLSTVYYVLYSSTSKIVTLKLCSISKAQQKAEASVQLFAIC
jgi:hypothetical protein